MDLARALQTTGTVREFADHPVPDEVVHDILDVARFAPSGGNRQAWRVVMVKDPALRRELRDMYLATWYEYLAIGQAGLVPWAPITDRDSEAKAAQDAERVASEARERGPGFAEKIDQAPVLLLLLADLRGLAAVDRDMDRYTLVGGASIYPFAWSILLAAHGVGLGGVMTTMMVRDEDRIRDLLGIPAELVVAGTLVLGYPAGRRPTRLRRGPVEKFATIDRFDGPPLEG